MRLLQPHRHRLHRCPAHRAVEAAERWHLFQPVARPKPRFYKQNHPCAVQCDCFWCGVRRFECAPRSLCASSAEKLFVICKSGKSADFPDLLFHGRGRGGNPLSQSLTALTAPPRGRLMAMPQSSPSAQKPSPWGRWLDAKRQDGRGIPATPKGAVALSTKTMCNSPF